MKLPEWLHRYLTRWAETQVARRPPDTQIGHDYLLRWEIIPTNPVLSLYVHLIFGPDPGRGLHDHRSCNLSILLEGGYVETMPPPGLSNWRAWYRHWADGLGRAVRVERRPGEAYFRWGSAPHRLDPVAPTLTIFITGPTYRRWGFWDKRVGWVHWRRYVDPAGPFQNPAAHPFLVPEDVQ